MVIDLRVVGAGASLCSAGNGVNNHGPAIGRHPSASILAPTALESHRALGISWWRCGYEGL